ncbi:ribbon-helix-helix protein, CopG family [Candidatus Woesearchaeota archaeon]|nr:ribbon-helix-helix protein, CopG family [Candidatus Woesearchaeota archaeon]
MTETMQFSLRIEPELVRTMDAEAEREYKTRTEFIKEAIQKLLLEKREKERMKQLAAELWLKGELSETQLKKALNEEEIKDLHFGKKWVDDIIYEIRQ